MPPYKRNRDRPGRPSEYGEQTRRPITVQWPVDLIEYVDSVAQNRTKWLIEAAQQRREREQQTLQEK